MDLTIGYLYGDIMNIYGDTGNITSITKRCEWRGINTSLKNISINTPLKAREVDIYFFGGGQDQSQIMVSKDLTETGKGMAIKADIERGVPLLSICGGYQLLGEYYKPHEGPRLEGIGLFPIITDASHNRMIGNIIIENGTFGKLVGFENHSGKTYLTKGAKSLGTVIKGFGNNGEDKTEGCIYKNAIGCYMHGSLLPKNTKLADWLIKKALETKYGKSVELKRLDDRIESSAHDTIISKYA